MYMERMMRKLKAFCIFILLVTLAATGVAQDNAPLFARIEKSIKDKEPNWQLVRKRIVSRSNIAYFEWKSGKSFVGVLMFITPSPEDATGTLEGLPDMLDMSKSKNRIPNLGDDNYLWEAQYTKGKVGVDFRKGKVAVHVTAFSIEDAKSFAQRIVDEIPAA
jgi:hypothetical protein